jgi:predicted transcriptional regulator
MGRRKSRTLTEVELEYMHVVWELGEVTTDDVLTVLREQGRDLSDGTVRKVLGILVTKGYLSRRQDGRGFRYSPEVPRHRANRTMLLDLLRRAFHGSASLMVAALLDTKNVDERELKEIRRLISEREMEQ